MSMGFVKSAYIKENFGGNKMFKKLKDKKGFTLVELIVVLVILAILAALLIPALTGYIDKAKEQSLTASCRQVVIASQSLVDEAYGKTKNAALGTAELTAQGVTAAKIKELAEVGGKFTVTVSSSGKLVTVVYYEGGKQITYTQATGQFTGFADGTVTDSSITVSAT